MLLSLIHSNKVGKYCTSGIGLRSLVMVHRYLGMMDPLCTLASFPAQGREHLNQSTSTSFCWHIHMESRGSRLERMAFDFVAPELFFLVPVFHLMYFGV